MISALLKILAGAGAVAALAFAATTIDHLPGSSASAMRRLQASADAALQQEAASWATVEMTGQTAVLTGAAPDAASLDAAAARVARAAGPGGLVFGGVTMVDARGLAVAAEPPPAVMPQAPAPTALSSEATAADAPQAAPAADASAENDAEALTTLAQEAPDLPAPVAETAGPDAIGDLIAAADTTPAEVEPEPGPSAAPDDAPETPSLAPTQTLAAEQDCIAALDAVTKMQPIDFSSGGAELDKPAREYLMRVSLAIMDCPEARVAIVGHSDASGRETRNIELSADRANAVRDFLIYMGAPPDRIAARGAGSTEPVAPNTTPEGRARNRRIDFNVVRSAD